MREVGSVRQASSLSDTLRVSRMRARGRASSKSVGVDDDVRRSVTFPGEDGFSSSSQEALARTSFID